MNVNHKTLILLSIPILLLLPLNAFAQENMQNSTEEETGPIPFIHAEIVIRNPQGQLVTYLEHYFFKIPDLKELNNFIDYTIEHAGAKIVVFNGIEHEMIRVTESSIWQFDQVRTIDQMTVLVNGVPTVFVEYDHDAYVLAEGDKRTVNWTILRPIE